MKTIRVEVIEARPGRQRVVTVVLEEGATARDALAASALGAEFAALGRFGRRIDAGARLRDGDRVALLRALDRDPAQARRDRARRRRY